MLQLMVVTELDFVRVTIDESEAKGSFAESNSTQSKKIAKNNALVTAGQRSDNSFRATRRR